MKLRGSKMFRDYTELALRILGADDHDLFGLVGDPDEADIDAAAARPDPLRIVLQGA